MNIYETKYSLNLNHLFTMAARKNLKRDFLFVSKVLGKHLAIRPIILKIIGGILCRLWAEERENFHDPDTDILVQALISIENNQSTSLKFMEQVNKILSSPIPLKHKTLFVGFAETATGLAQSVFSSSSNSYYIHTTRENITQIRPSVFFCEEHSHATDHMIYPLNSNIFDEVEDIVLIDDELTTGKTSLNLIRNLSDSKTFGIISILDWRNDEYIKMYQNEKSRNIKVCSLVKGTIECNKSGELAFDDPEVDYSHSPLAKHKDICFNAPDFVEGFIESTGRFGISSEQNHLINKEIKQLAEILKKEQVKGNCLCLGTGEFIYIPCLLSAELGEKIFFHSTTRSPIYSMDCDHYAIKNKIAFPSHDDNNVTNYLYNIPRNFYDQVFVFSEKTFNEEAKKNFKKIFGYFNINNVIFVSWNPTTYKRNVI